MSDKTRRALRMNRLRSDGTENTDLVTLVVRDPMTGEEIREDDGTPAVTIDLQPITEAERVEIVKLYTRLEKNPDGSRGLFELTDNAGAVDEMMRRAVVRWTGLVGCDDRPLACTKQTVVLIDAALRAQVTRKLFGAEAVVLSAESFR